jgi:hypothetical protein
MWLLRGTNHNSSYVQSLNDYHSTIPYKTNNNNNNKNNNNNNGSRGMGEVVVCMELTALLHTNPGLQ